MPHTRAWSLLASLLIVATLLPAQPPAAAAPPPPDPLAQLTAETGAALRVSHHPATGQVNFLALGGGRAWQPPAPAAAAPEAVAESAARQFLAAYGSVFGLQGRPGELAVLRAPVREDGRTYVRFQQTAAGVPVFGGELVVQVSPAGGVEAVIGKTLPNLTAPARPVVTAAEAQAAALQAVAGVHGVDPAALRAAEPALWLYNPVLTEPHAGPTRLVWRLDVTPVDLLPIRQLVLIDAQRGTVALQFNQVDYALNRLTYDANNGTLLPGTLRCDETNPACTGGDTHEVAAHTYAGDTYDFYQAMHGRDSIDGAGLTLISTVHYGSNYDNAFWNGSQMVYGDAFGFALADDVVAHELTHGVTQYESNLFYYYQSGAINESLSDVWGELLDLTNGAGNDSPGVRWDLGEDITGYGAIRDMADPAAFGDPDRMTSANYKSASGDITNGTFDNGGVHTNSGVNNKAAYLMVDGGTFNSITVSPLGITKTAKIYYHTASNLLTSGSDYLDLYNALYQSCTTLVGTAGIVAADCQEVRDATEAVEMDEQPVANHNTHAPLCPAGQTVATTFFFDNLEANAANWTTGALAGTNRWSRNADFAYSGTYSLLGNDFPAATSDSFAAMNASVAITNGTYLHFQHAYGFEGASADGGIVEYSTNGGASWTSAGALFDFNGYDGAISTGPLAGSQGFIADSHGYISSRLLLEPLAGQSVRFRFRLGLGTSGADMGWWVDDVRIYTCSGSPVAALRTYLPGVMRNSGASGTWETVMQEDFEGPWPSGLWTADEPPGINQYFWAKRDCRAAAGGFSAWAMGGGSLGSGQGCGADYVDFAFAWMVFGPVNLNGSTAAEFNLSLWLQTEPDFDAAYVMASTDGNLFYGTRYTGSTSGAFSPVSLDLKNVFTLGDVTDDANTWVAVLFESDESFVEAEGAYVDDLVLRRCTAAACPSAGLALGAPSTLLSAPAAFARSAGSR